MYPDPHPALHETEAGQQAMHVAGLPEAHCTARTAEPRICPDFMAAAPQIQRGFNATGAQLSW